MVGHRVRTGQRNNATVRVKQSDLTAELCSETIEFDPSKNVREMSPTTYQMESQILKDTQKVSCFFYFYLFVLFLSEFLGLLLLFSFGCCIQLRRVNWSGCRHLVIYPWPERYTFCTGAQSDWIIQKQFPSAINWTSSQDSLRFWLQVGASDWRCLPLRRCVSTPSTPPTPRLNQFNFLRPIYRTAENRTRK